MFDFSFSEIALVVVVALLVLDPKDLPVIVKTLRGWWREIQKLTDEVKAGVNEVMQETGIDDITNEMEEDIKYITDLEGKPQRTYSLEDFEPAPKDKDKGEGA